MTIEDVRSLMEQEDQLVFKYVRLTSGEYRFGRLNECFHRYLMRPGEKAASAGELLIDIQSRTAQVDGESKGLSLQPDEHDRKNLPALLGCQLIPSQ